MEKAKRKVNKTKIRLKAGTKKVTIWKASLKNKNKIKDLFDFMVKKPKRSFMRIKNNANSICSIVIELLSSRSGIILLSLILLMKTALFYNDIGLEREGKDIAGLIFLLISVCPLLLIKKNKNRFRLMLIYDILFSTLIFADSVYWNYSANLLSFSQVRYVKYAEEIGGALPYLFNLSHLLYFIDIPILLFAWRFANKKIITKSKTKIVQNKGKRRIVIAVAYIACVIIIGIEPVSKCTEQMKETPYLKLKKVELGSIYGYHYLDIYTTLNKKKWVKYNTYNQMMEDYSKLEEYSLENITKQEDLQGIAEGKNVIIVQLESVQNFVVNRTINGNEITPNLNKFLRDNIEFTNMTMQSYSTTADSEYSVITSLYPLDNGEAYSAYFASINNDIFNLYKNAGYNTSYMHGNIAEFWNRKDVYKRLNIDETVFLDSFQDTSEKINDYLSDELFYRQAVQKLSEKEEPFMTMLVAASSHIPFNLYGIEYKDQKVSIDVGDLKDEFLGNYLEAVNYADYAFGILLDELKTNELYDDTVIIVYGDHYGMPMENEDMEDFIKLVNPNYNEISKYINYTNVLCGMKIPGVESKKIERVISKVDIKPTLLELSGIEDDFSLGESMFSSKNYAVISNGNIVTQEYYFLNDSWYYINSGEEVDMENLDIQTKEILLEYEENMRLELDISNSIPINNLLKK